jgi:hypothetical protein
MSQILLAKTKDVDTLPANHQSDISFSLHAFFNGPDAHQACLQSIDPHQIPKLDPCIENEDAEDDDELNHQKFAHLWRRLVPMPHQNHNPKTYNDFACIGLTQAQLFILFCRLKLHC